MSVERMSQVSEQQVAEARSESFEARPLSVMERREELWSQAMFSAL